VPAWISCYLGVTEPAIFGVNLKYFFPFICGMTGSACAAVVCVSTSTTANAIGVGGVPGILSIQPQYMPSFALSMVAAIVVPFILTVIVGKKKGVDKENVLEMASVDHVEGSVVPVQAAACEHELLAFLDGEVISLAEVNDGVFSAGMVGEGLAGHEDVTVCIITNKNGVDSFAFKTGIQGKAGETVIAAY